MDDKQRVRASKFLSKHLRHQPAALGLTLEDGGWVSIDALLAGCQKAGLPLTPDDLAEIVATSDKQRFAFDETGDRIRANQGHSVDVDLLLEPSKPPARLFHGTPERFVPAILREGLRKMSRHHVHLSADAATATRVGARRGRPVVLAIDAAAMFAAGHLFFVSANAVWLTDRVPPEFLRVVEGPNA
ncbi:MAG: RNA 2'-phosphotransferase [Zavarzinella sp.]|nr:RNA 2'-phosphotransferase [Zavarzinella sp.]